MRADGRTDVRHSRRRQQSLFAIFRKRLKTHTYTHTRARALYVTKSYGDNNMKKVLPPASRTKSLLDASYSPHPTLSLDLTQNQPSSERSCQIIH